VEDFLIALVIIAFVLFNLSRSKLLVMAIKGLFMTKDERQRLDTFYNKHFIFYKQLPEKSKSRFLYRTHSILQEIRILGRHGFTVTQEVRQFVVGSMVQLTLGLEFYTLPRFKTVLIYPDSFLSPFTGKRHDGEVNPRGIVVLSWKRFCKGYEDSTDALNLGLHEMAHALMLTIKYSNRKDNNIDKRLNAVLNLAEIERKNVIDNPNHLFREYAGLNAAEFFAVSVENFFEKPKEFKAELPALYRQLVKLLNQDPSLL
jgi:Mlc titration factor MtfA (ptsG expression regulator)